MTLSKDQWSKYTGKIAKLTHRLKEIVHLHGIKTHLHNLVLTF